MSLITATYGDKLPEKPYLDYIDNCEVCKK